MCAAGFAADAAGEWDAADLPRESAQEILLRHRGELPVIVMI